MSVSDAWDSPSPRGPTLFGLREGDPSSGKTLAQGSAHGGRLTFRTERCMPSTSTLTAAPSYSPVTSVARWSSQKVPLPRRCSIRHLPFTTSPRFSICGAPHVRNASTRRPTGWTGAAAPGRDESHPSCRLGTCRERDREGDQANHSGPVT